KIAEQFYTSAGIPIDEDPAWDYEGRYGTRKGDANHRFYIGLNHTTAALNFDREPRFHAWLSFDRGVFEGAGRTEDNSFVLEMRQGETSGMRSKSEHNVCGYVIKKLVNPQSAFAANSNNFIAEPYSFPLVRLSDLYLLYAETLNETRGPSEETYKWIDLVRTRAGLKGVKESWAQSTKPDKPNTKEGLREIIKRERLIELSFEGQRFWDLRRWNDAMQYMNEPVRGWNYQKAQPEDYYKVTNVWTNRVFQPKDYLWPIKVSTLIVNTNLKQNPGWGTGDSQ
ncbi:MAG: RagB/SusD family nutrient uptake outer membrane protein, partial [Prevotellaceae bacterium]|nr:RagB/SusD family nutrient uptake outer membrane protein [Prevotellaceae bacterium]